MDINSALSREIFRPLAITVCPGALAITPWVALLILANEKTHTLVAGYPGAAAFLYLIACIASGLLLENIGSHIETIHWQSLKAKDPAVDNEWDTYLQLQLGNEIIGQRYLREILFRAKFELSTAPALFFLATGILAIQYHSDPWTSCSVAVTAAIAFMASAWLYREARDSVELLSKIRRQVITGKQGLPTSTPAGSDPTPP